ncbi:GATA zinc finger domain-containing protein 14-like [Aphidius gifuensis]|uniref:GATA zinc finger domain-containing protein 14-like n=1 Tax=Aphidius gifuensis TaxID=684658 RepID=UPI001CDD2F7E|nr:GATA zinc finger domain-containing protein 14-like [Aphidius gifuensis]
MFGRPSERKYQLAAQKRHEEAVKFDYYNQTAKYWERECGKAKKFNTWNVDELKSKKLENIKKAEALKIRQNKLREILNTDEEIYNRENKNLESKTLKKEEFTIEALREKLQEKRTEQSLYNPHTFKRIQSYFSNPSKADCAILKNNKMSGNSINSFDGSDNNNMMSSSPNHGLCSKMDDFKIRAQEFKDNRIAAQGSNISTYLNKSPIENDASPTPYSGGGSNTSMQSNSSSKSDINETDFNKSINEINQKNNADAYDIRSQEFKDNQTAGEGTNIGFVHNKKFFENELDSRGPDRRHITMGNQVFLEDDSSTKPVHQYHENDLHHTAAFDTRAQEFKNNQAASEGSSVGFYQPYQSSQKRNENKNNNELHHTAAHDIRSEEFNTNRAAGEGSNIAHAHQDEQPMHASNRRHFLLGNRVMLGDNSSNKSVSENKGNDLQHTAAYDIRAREYKTNQTAGEGSSISFGHEKPYFQNELGPRGSDRRHIYQGNQTFLEDDSSTKPIDDGSRRSLQQIEAFDLKAQKFEGNQTDDESSNNKYSLDKESNNLHHTKAYDIRAQEFKENQAAGNEGYNNKNLIDSQQKQFQQRDHESYGLERRHYAEDDKLYIENDSSNRHVDGKKGNDLHHTKAFDIRAQEFKDNQAAGEGSGFTFGNEKSQFSQKQLRRGSDSSGGSSSSSSKKSFGQQDNASAWRPNSKYADRYKRRSLEGTNVSDTAGSREATPPLASDEHEQNNQTDKQQNHHENLTSHHNTPVHHYIDHYNNEKSQMEDETDKSSNYNRNASFSMLAYLTHSKLKSQIMDLEKRESRAVTKQEWEDALRLREMRNNLELFREKRMWEHLDDNVNDEVKKQAWDTIQTRIDQLKQRVNFCENTELYSEEAKLTWKKWDREDQQSSLIAVEKYRQSLLEKLEEEWQQLAGAEKIKVTGLFEKSMASQFQHEMCLLSKLNRH